MELPKKVTDLINFLKNPMINSQVKMILDMIYKAGFDLIPDKPLRINILDPFVLTITKEDDTIVLKLTKK